MTDTTDATEPFVPELGQAAFSHGAIQSYEAYWASAGLGMIADAVAEARGTDASLASNYGAEPWISDLFEMRSYCWCDGDGVGHEEQCPPNFVYKPTGFTICWYKHSGRGVSANSRRPKGWMRIVNDCVGHVLDHPDPNSTTGELA